MSASSPALLSPGEAASSTKKHAAHGHGHGGEDESPIVKFFISGIVSLSFELVIGHFLEYSKISKQTSTLTYAQLTKQMVQHKGIAGILDGFFPWGAIQCFAKGQSTYARVLTEALTGASFGLGHQFASNALKGRLSDFNAEVVSGGFGGGVQGVVMSPLLLLKTRIMTMPEMRHTGGIIATTIASSKIGVRVVRAEGVTALFKGVTIFASKRTADWSSRFLFAELCSDALKKRKGSINSQLSFGEKSFASLGGGIISATVTLPVDVLVATVQSAGKAGQKTSVMSIWKEQMRDKGITGLVQYSTRGYAARLLHVGCTTMLMRSVSSAVYTAYDKIKPKRATQ